MASIYDIKPKFQDLLRPLVNGLAHAGVTANQVTVAAVLLSAMAGGLIARYPDQRWPLLLLPLALFVRMALNAIDGMLAREHDMQTPLGAVLNEISDVLSDAVLYLPLAFVAGVDGGWLVGVVLLAVISEMTGVVAVQIGAQRRYDGPMGKSDRALVFAVVGLLLGLGAAPGVWLDSILILLALLLVLTIVNRARHALAEIKS